MSHTTEKSHLDKIVPVRLSTTQWGIIRKEAIRKGIGVSTLTRMWIIEYLGKLGRKNRIKRRHTIKSGDRQGN